MASFPLPPNKSIGILGGGQLGRMTAQAAAELGYRAVVFAPEPAPPASQVAADTVTAPWDDRAALHRFAEIVDVVTLEFENVPVSALEYLEKSVPVRPSAKALSVAQDRLAEKSFVRDQGIGTPPFVAIDSADAIPAGIDDVGQPAVLKTRRFGYDGKGQVRLESADAATTAWRQVGGRPSILEAWVPFEREVSAIVARDSDGRVEAFDVVENIHESHILRKTIAPAQIPKETAAAVIDAATRLAHALEIVGLLAVEFFVLREGNVLVNELAPRPHNSGHWTLDACSVDQFQQLVRAIAGLPLGTPRRLANAEMTNLLGNEADNVIELLAAADTCVHLYGKAEARAGRKMGHVTRLLPF